MVVVSFSNYVLQPIERAICSLIISYTLQNSLGTLDGTYIKANIPTSERPRYRTRKDEVATNVLGVCATKGDFVFVLVSCGKDQLRTHTFFDMPFQDRTY